jgi:hypothetical protein
LEILSKAVRLNREKRNYQPPAMLKIEGFELLFKNGQNSAGNKYGKACIFEGAIPYFCKGLDV